MPSKITDLTALGAAPADEDLIEMTDDPSGTPASRSVTMAELREAMALPVLHVRDEKATTVHGGASAATTWNVRDLNTVGVNQITGASLASNQITLPAGTYRIRARAPATKVDEHVLRLRNVTDGTTTLVGSTALSFNADTSQEDSILWGVFTIAAEKTFELQHWTEDAKATNGLGNATGSGEVEVYAEVWIEQEA